MASQATGPGSVEMKALRTFFDETNRETKWSRTEGWWDGSDLNQWHGLQLNDAKQVRWLTMNKNGITGTLPSCLGDLQMLEKLRLATNSLTGSIPQTLGKLSKLKSLTLSHNKLTGPIPHQLSTLHALEELILGENELTGKIPGFLSSLSQLKSVSLDGNRLEGSIPPLDGLSKLKRLDLSNNLLTGTVPRSLWQLENLTTLMLHLNRLERLTDEVDGPAAGDEVVTFLEQIDEVEYLNFDSNPWELPPASVVVKGLDSIRSYYRTWASVGDVTLTTALKVVFVGTASAGKTSLMRSIRAGRGDRTTHDQGDPSTVGVDLHTHMLRDSTRCKLYDLAGQLDYRGLHQLFLTESALYIVVFDVTFFEGKQDNALSEATKTHILDWITLLHLRLTVCTVQLVASHCDMLRGNNAAKNDLVKMVKQEFTRQHEKWKSDRRKYQDGPTDTQMVVLKEIIPVGCCLRSEEKGDPGLTYIRDELLEKAASRSYIPRSWVEARAVLDAIGGDTEQGGNPCGGREPLTRAWAMRSEIHEKFFKAVSTLKADNPVRGLLKADAHDAMEGAIELRAFSGTLLSRDSYVLLDVAYIAAALKPILNHKIDESSTDGTPMFSGKKLEDHTLQSGAKISRTTLKIYRNVLVKRGILRRDFASFLWEDPTRRHAVPQKSLQGILEELGVAIPLPQSPATEDEDEQRDCTDLLVLMRLDKHPTETHRVAIERVMGSETGGLKAVWKFGYGGAPYGFPEEVIALCHRLGDVSPTIYWRHGALFTRKEDGVFAKAKALVRYDEESETLTFETSGREEWDFTSLRFAISAVRHVTVKYRGVFWEGWVACWQHTEEAMYHLAGSKDHLNGPRAGFEADIIPPKKQDVEQDNSCDYSHEGCGLPLEKFGRTVDVVAPIDRFAPPSTTEVTGAAVSGVTAEPGPDISPRQNAFLAVVTVAAGIFLPWGLAEGNAIGVWIGVGLLVIAGVLALKKFNPRRGCCSEELPR